MNLRAVEILVGIFMLLFFAAMLVLALRVSNLTSFGASDGYSLTAQFDNVGGLQAGAPVSASGVRVGQVDSIVYSPDEFAAMVTLSVNSEFVDAFPEDTTASIYTAGLLGEQYIGLEAGAEDLPLADGDEITLTQSALVLERLIGQVLFSRSGSE